LDLDIRSALLGATRADQNREHGGGGARLRHQSVVQAVKFPTVFYGVIPFVFTDILRPIILIAFPIIALWLPSRM
jgi:hypothetical protein